MSKPCNAEELQNYTTESHIPKEKQSGATNNIYNENTNQNSSQISVESSPKIENHPHDQSSASNVDSVPDGGFLAWLQVVGAFFLFFNTWGIINSYGAYQTYYEEDLLMSSDSSAISWIGSIQSFLIMFIGAGTGPLYDAGYFRALIITGTALVVFGHMMLSLCTVYWQVLLAQGFCIAIGSGALFLPGVAILSTYFTTKISFAVGIAASGSSIGGVVYPVIFRELQPKIGFAWTVRVTGFILLATLLVSNAVMKVRVLPAGRRKIVDWSAFKELPYTLFNLGSFLSFMGLYTPFYYIQLFAIDQHITSSGSGLAFYLLAIINAASTFGRIIPNFLADKTGPFNMMVPCALISSILILCLLSITKLGPLLAFCVLYGFFSGSFVSLMPSILVLLSPNPSLVGTRMGMSFSMVAIGLLIGTPIAGAILNDHGFGAVWIYGGIFTAAGSGVVFLARNFRVRWRIISKT
ncbi:MAG: hypothetical protein M1834_009457 [Cirrosporium novae-zelandiae]|nr:MAG: hypothetical protein M1834_009457 [Cirrosporium novae-zelandiae]